MIKDKHDLKRYLICDAANNNYKRFFDATKKYLILLRKTEYHINTNHKFRSLYYRWRFKRLSLKYMTFIPYNTFGPGLSIPHLGCIYVNGNAVVGDNCSIHETVTVGATGGQSKAPKIGNNVFIGSGAKVIGDIVIADNVAIGAGAVVVKSILDEGTTWGGVPAHKISNNNSHSHLRIFNNKAKGDSRWK